MDLEEQLEVPEDGALGIQECLRLITKFKQLVILITKGCPSGLWHMCQSLWDINLCQLNLILQTLVIYPEM